jgi:hypothetical protein
MLPIVVRIHDANWVASFGHSSTKDNQSNRRCSRPRDGLGISEAKPVSRGTILIIAKGTLA